MEIESLEVYSRDSNYAVIKPPGRTYPGTVVQGDSLGNLCRNALRIVQYIESGDTKSNELLGEVEDLTNALVDRMLHYQNVLKLHGIDFPHVPPFSDSDLVRLVDEDNS